MKIHKNTLKQINDFVPDKPPEVGGILGSRENGIITDIMFDRNQLANNKMCYYAPNVDSLNQCIKEWYNSNIYFKGIFHTHFAGVKTLSEADKKYIYRIMNCMPQEIRQLYFPIFVIPERELICYIADRENICKDTLCII